MAAFTVYPFSRGHLHITGPDLGDPVDFKTGFFTDEGQIDIKKHIWIYKKQREIIRRMPSKTFRALFSLFRRCVSPEAEMGRFVKATAAF